MYKFKVFSVIIMYSLFTNTINAADMREENTIKLWYATTEFIVDSFGTQQNLKGKITVTKDIGEYYTLKISSNQGEIIVAVNEPDNSLKVFASQRDFSRLSKLVKKLDTQKVQEPIDATINELDLFH
jgi:hypothetical protein